MNDSQQPLALFTSSDGQVRLQLKLVEQSLWLTQRQIAELFEKSPPTINEHLKNIYDEGELDPASTIRKFRTVAMDGTRSVERLLEEFTDSTKLISSLIVLSGTKKRNYLLNNNFLISSQIDMRINYAK